MTILLSLLHITSTALGHPTVKETSDSSVTISFIKVVDTSHKYTYHAEAKAIGGAVHQSDCDGETSAFADDDCGFWP